MHLSSAVPPAAGLAAGALLDAAIGDPRRGHPVAGFGAFANRIEHRVYADTKKAGLVFVAATVLPVLALGAASTRLARTGFLLTTGATWTVLGGRSLRRAGHTMSARLSSGDLTGSRLLMPTLCGRDPASLDEDGIARATVESIAENTSDAIVAPLFWGAVAGVPGLLGYRAINTLDAMVGHRSTRYARFGTAAAKLDDAANYLPARLCASLTILAAPLVAGSATEGWRAWRRDASAHPSPNAGRCEAAMAGVLGIGLGGPTTYDHRVEQRPILGSGPAPAAADIIRTVRLSQAVEVATVLLAVGLRLARSR